MGFVPALTKPTQGGVDCGHFEVNVDPLRWVMNWLQQGPVQMQHGNTMHIQLQCGCKQHSRGGPSQLLTRLTFYWYSKNQIKVIVIDTCHRCSKRRCEVRWNSTESTVFNITVSNLFNSTRSIVLIVWEVLCDARIALSLNHSEFWVTISTF